MLKYSVRYNLGVSCTNSGLTAASVAQGKARLPGQLDISDRGEGRVIPVTWAAACTFYPSLILSVCNYRRLPKVDGHGQ
jgi:hypothetical protein